MNKRHRIGPDNPNFRTGKSLSRGYVVLSSKVHGPNIGRREHRVVIEQALGRHLSIQEIVHHKNGDTADNKLENLALTDRAAHNRIHGGGKLLVCTICGVERWYGPAGIAKLRNGGIGYRCRPCALGHRYDKACLRCGGAFSGMMTAQYCAGCTRKGRGARRRFWQ